MAVIKCSECGGVVSTSAKSCPHCGALPKKFKTTTSLGKILLYVALAGVLFSVILPKKEKPVETASVPAKEAHSMKSDSASTDVSPRVLFSDAQVCKATIAKVMGRSVSSMSDSAVGGETFVSYVRADDQKKFDYKCKISGAVTVWATKIDGKWGRWRDLPEDGVVKFKEQGGKLYLTEVYGDSSSDSDVFSVSDF